MDPFISSTMYKVSYEGSLRTRSIHLKSEETLITDAPVDNNGKGEAFSPTDLVASSLASCMMTIMGIAAEKKGLVMPSVAAEVQKVMASNPRSIGEIRIRMTLGENSLSLKDRAILEHAAKACPVAKSLHPDVVQMVEFVYL